MIDRCPACQSDSAQLIFRSRLGCGVRSNGQFLPQNPEIWACGDCGLIFKPLSRVVEVSDYCNYAAMGNSPDRDKLDFSGEQPVGRSQVLIDYLKAQGCVTAGTQVLDYGCHRGAFLKLLHPDGRARCPAAGYDMTDDYRGIISDLGFDYYTPLDRPPTDQFDLISLIHVVEHFHVLEQDFCELLPALRTNGQVVIQVPDIVAQFTDAYVLDHRSHFCASTLAQSMQRLGLLPVRGPLSIIAGELTGVFQVTSVVMVDRESVPAHDQALLVDSLVACEARLAELKAEAGPVWVYGAGNLGALVAGYLGDQVLGFIDDNPKLHNEQFQGLPVEAPSCSGSESYPWVIAVPPVATELLIRRCKNQGILAQAPFLMTASDQERLQ